MNSITININDNNSNNHYHYSINHTIIVGSDINNDSNNRMATILIFID